MGKKRYSVPNEGAVIASPVYGHFYSKQGFQAFIHAILSARNGEIPIFVGSTIHALDEFCYINVPPEGPVEFKSRTATEALLHSMNNAAKWQEEVMPHLVTAAKEAKKSVAIVNLSGLDASDKFFELTPTNASPSTALNLKHWHEMWRHNEIIKHQLISDLALLAGYFEQGAKLVLQTPKDNLPEVLLGTPLNSSKFEAMLKKVNLKNLPTKTPDEHLEYIAEVLKIDFDKLKKQIELFRKTRESGDVASFDENLAIYVFSTITSVTFKYFQDKTLKSLPKHLDENARNNLIRVFTGNLYYKIAEFATAQCLPEGAVSYSGPKAMDDSQESLVDISRRLYRREYTFPVTLVDGDSDSDNEKNSTPSPEASPSNTTPHASPSKKNNEHTGNASPDSDGRVSPQELTKKMTKLALAGRLSEEGLLLFLNSVTAVEQPHPVKQQELDAASARVAPQANTFHPEPPASGSTNKVLTFSAPIPAGQRKEVHGAPEGVSPGGSPSSDELGKSPLSNTSKLTRN